MADEPLVDGHGRRIADLRVSVTDRCNFRCQYCMPAEGLPWLEREAVLTLRGDRAARARWSPDGRHRRAPDGRRAARAPRLPAARRDAARLAGRRGPRVTTNGYLLERDAEALVRAGVDALQRLDRLAAARPLLRDDAPRRASAGAARARGARRATPRRTRSRSTPSRCAASPRTRCCPFARVRARAPVRGALHRVHAARRRPRVDARQRPHAATRSARSSTPCTRSSRRRARPTRPRGSTASPTATGAIGFINPVSEPFCGGLQPHPADGRRQAADLPVLAATRPTCARRCATGASDDELERSSATPSGARSSSTTSTSRASSSPRAR